MANAFDLSGVVELDSGDFVGGASDAAMASESLDQSAGSMGQSLWDVDPAAFAAGGALASLGTAAQKTLDDTRDLREGLDRTATTLGITDEEARELATSMSNATFPLRDVEESMDNLSAMVETPQRMEEVAVAADNVADATDTSASSITENLAPAVNALDGDLNALVENQDAFTLAARESNMSVEDIGQTLSKLDFQKLEEMGLKSSEVTGLMAEFADETGYTGRQLQSNFNQAVEAADGDLEKLQEELGLGGDALSEWEQRVRDAEGVTDEHAEAVSSNVSTMDKIRARYEDAKLAASEYLGPLEALAPAAQATGAGMMALSTINLSAVAPSFAAVSTAAAPITAIVLGLAAAAGALYVAWETNFLGIQNVTEDALEAIGRGWDWLTGKISDAVDWTVDKVLAIPDVLGDIIDAIPGIDSEDVLGDVDVEDIKDSVFPAKPDDDGEEVGKQMGEGVARGAQQGAEDEVPPEEFISGDESPEEMGRSAGQSMGQGLGEGIVEGLEVADVAGHLEERLDERAAEVEQMEDRLAELERIESAGVISDSAEHELETLREDLPEAREELSDLQSKLEEVRSADSVTEVEADLVADTAEKDLREEREEAEKLQAIYDELDGRDIAVESDVDPTAFDEVDVDAQVERMQSAPKDGEDTQGGRRAILEQIIAELDALRSVLEGPRELSGEVEFDPSAGLIRFVDGRIDQAEESRYDEVRARGNLQ